MATGHLASGVFLGGYFTFKNQIRKNKKPTEKRLATLAGPATKQSAAVGWLLNGVYGILQPDKSSSTDQTAGEAQK